MPIQTSRKKRRTFLNILDRQRGWVILISIGAVVSIWQVLVWIFKFPAFILPSPWEVVLRFGSAIADGALLRNTAYTLLEVILGLLIGCLLAITLGYFLGRSRFLERIISPILVASQAIPVVAVAPLLVIWFGPGLVSKILICALIVFFPVLVNTVVGIRAVSEHLRDLMKSFRATRIQVLRYLEVPGAMPIFLGGLRIGATLSVIGAVVGEFVGSDRGLGFLISIARGQYDTALVFVAILTLIILALALYGAVLLLEHYFLKWQKVNE
jgi:NitT/TauT family transport system permease protein